MRVFAGLEHRRISCPYCGETLRIDIDPSAGGQDYVEDCQVCCQPMQVRYEVVDGAVIDLNVDRGD